MSNKAYLNDVKAGDYEIVAPYWDEILSKPGQPFDFKRHRRGETVTLDVEQARRLVYAGAVVKPGESDKVEQPGSEQSVAPGTKPAKSADSVFDPAVGGKIPETLTYVGDDKVKAQAMLDLESAKGADARASLVEKLEATITDPSGTGS